MDKGPVSQFIERNYLHFNAAALVDAARGYDELMRAGGKMMISLAGAMSTAELGISLAEMIRKDKVHIISCTGANLEEDVFNLVAHKSYKRIPHYRDLTPQDEAELLRNGLSRVTDTCIPEEQAMRRVGQELLQRWRNAEEHGNRHFPHEYFYDLLLSDELRKDYQIDPAHSWLLAAAEKNLPIVVPGWEDSTLGNSFAANCVAGHLAPSTVKSGVEAMVFLANWYSANSSGTRLGFFQIGGGIAGDFPICVVPMLVRDLEKYETPLWSYFCQISDSTTSYGSYSGAVPNEKISWGKIATNAPSHVIESDATIVAPLIFAWVLGW